MIKLIKGQEVKILRDGSKSLKRLEESGWVIQDAPKKPGRKPKGQEDE